MIKSFRQELYSKFLNYHKIYKNDFTNYLFERLKNTQNPNFYHKEIQNTILIAINSHALNTQSISKEDLLIHIHKKEIKNNTLISGLKKLSIPLMVPLYFVFEFGIAEPLMEEFVNYKNNNGAWTVSEAAHEFSEQYEEKTWQAWVMITACLVSGIIGGMCRFLPERLKKNEINNLNNLKEASVAEASFNINDVINFYCYLTQDYLKENIKIDNIKLQIQSTIDNAITNQDRSIENLEKSSLSLKNALFNEKSENFAIKDYIKKPLKYHCCANIGKVENIQV